MQLLEAGTKLNIYYTFKSFPFLGWYNEKYMYYFIIWSRQVLHMMYKAWVVTFCRIRCFTAGKCSILSLCCVFFYVNGCRIHIGVIRNLCVPR